MSFESIQSQCKNMLEIQITPPVITEDIDEIADVAVEIDEHDCELTPESEKCEEPLKSRGG